MNGAALDLKTLNAELRQLFGEGFLDFRTPPDAGPGEPVLAQTLMQLDGDFLVAVDPAVFDEPELLARHHEQVRAFHGRLTALLTSGRVFYRGLFAVAAAGGPLYGVYTCVSLWVEEGWRSALGQAAVWFLTPFIPVVLKKGLLFALQLYIKRRFKSAVGAPPAAAAP